ncbi:hypothetical protein LOD99_7691 [Oopsacas minuta]|uniref:Uncharacterized protein n=1 Tax=Oopsacas minuta TaxID=111878 RepID=A0AAV7JPN2_9METZ|nr:hypothetical protein LOD99_7691 [Oopsacas minuta]
MDTLSFDNLFGNTSVLQMLTGFDAVAINGATVTVLICLCLGDVLICCCGCLLCCCVWRNARSSHMSSYTIKPIIQRKSTYNMPAMSRLSRISNSGIVEMEWVQNHKSSEASDIPLHQHTGNNLILSRVHR